MKIHIVLTSFIKLTPPRIPLFDNYSGLIKEMSHSGPKQSYQLPLSSRPSAHAQTNKRFLFPRWRCGSRFSTVTNLGALQS